MLEHGFGRAFLLQRPAVHWDLTRFIGICRPAPEGDAWLVPKIPIYGDIFARRTKKQQRKDTLLLSE